MECRPLLLKEPLAHSMHLYFSLNNFSCWNKASNLIHRQMALGDSETAKLQTTPPTRACAVCQLELCSETKSNNQQGSC